MLESTPEGIVVNLPDRQVRYLYSQVAAEALGVTPYWLLKLVRNGTLQHVRIGREVLISEDSLADAASFRRSPGRPRKTNNN
jgi:excisionase family DNA binding protein